MTEAAEQPVVEVITGPAALQQQEQAALDVQVATAKQYPRSVTRFESDLRSWCRMSQRVAESCFYALPRGGAKIIGPSIRFAELVLAAWGNCVVDAKVIVEEGGYVVCDGICRDLERNIASRTQVRRRITGKDGKRYQEHVIESTIMAGLAIARRNAIMSVIPRALWESIWEEAKGTAAGSMADFRTIRAAVVEKLEAAEIPEANWLHYVGRESVKDVVADDVLALQLALAQIERGESKLEDLFPDPVATEEAAQEAASAASDAIRGAAKTKEEPADEAEQDVRDAIPEDWCGVVFNGPDGEYVCNRKPRHRSRHAFADEEESSIVEEVVK